MKSRKFSDPYLTKARFKSQCSNCGKTIEKYDSIVYDKYRKLVYCISGTGNDCGTSVLNGVY